MILELTCGAGAGLGLALIAYGLRPPRPALADVLDTLGRTPRPAPAGRERAYAAIAAPMRRLGLPTARVRADLYLLQRDISQHLAEQATATLAGALVLPLAATLAGFTGAVPVWLGVLGGVVGYRWIDARLHAAAEARRAELRHTLGVQLTLLTIALARGAGLEQALDEVAGACTGWAADRLRHVLAAAHALRRPPWPALGELGAATDVTELCDLAASMTLAGTEGARIRQTLAARATAIRTAATAAMEADAEKASSRMSLPLLILGLSYLLFLLYPPLMNLGAAF